jgi:hypothetical protein
MHHLHPNPNSVSRIFEFLLLRGRWGWIIFGLIGVALGIYLIRTMSDTTHWGVRSIQGRLASDYTASSIFDSTREEPLKLTDGKTYSVPECDSGCGTFPLHIPANTQVSLLIWTKQDGSYGPNIAAITIYDSLGNNPKQYNTPAYENRERNRVLVTVLGWIFLIAGGVVALVGLVWWAASDFSSKYSKFP